VLVSIDYFFKIFRYQRVFLSAVGTMNFPASADAGATGLLAEHVEVEFMFTITAFHARNPLV
jgi:hypothetical protein